MRIAPATLSTRTAGASPETTVRCTLSCTRSPKAPLHACSINGSTIAIENARVRAAIVAVLRRLGADRLRRFALDENARKQRVKIFTPAKMRGRGHRRAGTGGRPQPQSFCEVAALVERNG